MTRSSLPSSALAVLLLLALPDAATPAAVAYVNLADAYERSTALKGLLPQLDAAMGRIRTQFDQARAPLSEQLEALKSSRMHEEARLKRKRELLLELAALEQTSTRQQQAIAKANEAATALVDAEIQSLREALKTELGLLAVFPTQDLLYFPAQSPLDLSAELYRRLNERLPELKLDTAGVP